MKLTIELIHLLVESPEPFPVELDDAWKWLGFKSKRAAKQILLESFEPGLDFLQNLPKASGGRPLEVFTLTVDCFKSLGMMAATPKGREVRKYFLECERQIKEIMSSTHTPAAAPTTEPTPPAPVIAALPPAPGWEPQLWNTLPPPDQAYFSETPEVRAERVAVEWEDLRWHIARWRV